MSQLHRVPAHPALTLVELLVVVTIMVLLVGVVLPLAKPALKGRETREAVRQVNTFLAGAAARAMATGRPTGVQFVPSPSDPNRCFSLVTVKDRPPFAGEGPSSRVRVEPSSGRLYWSDGTDAAIAARLRMNPNDAFRIKFDFRGHIYDGIYNGTNFEVDLSDIFKPLPPGPQFDTGAAYQVFLPPRKSAAASLDLPLGTYIDLSLSGFSTDGIIRSRDGGGNPYPMILMFHPSGSLDRFHGWVDRAPYSGTPGLEDVVGSWRPTADVALLIARGKDQQDDDTDNLSPAAGSLWVTVNQRTGQAKTTENLGSTATDLADRLIESRQSAFSGPNMGGR